MSVEKINLAEKLSAFSVHWTPRIVGDVDDYASKIAKLAGDFVWHAHQNEDGLFFVLNGAFRMDFRDRQVDVGTGEMIIVPRGVEHIPFAEEECAVRLFEQRGVTNTGDAGGELTVDAPERI
ncbi:MAG: hypothetical protein CL566_01080 [Alphaproteobacteria bacterium]|nr:hypothetical protein [Alphaproteobacteria bacterium]